jgi:peptidoglycan hydrolase-like protein with peptidoglycan-binding domain
MPPRLITYSILQDANNANLIYLGTNLGVYQSLDRGASWAPVWTAAKVEPVVKKRGTKKQATMPRPPQAAAVKPNETVRKAQQALNAAGYSVGVPDGHAGKQTIAAVRKYQADRHLPERQD